MFRQPPAPEPAIGALASQDWAEEWASLAPPEPERPVAAAPEDLVVGGRTDAIGTALLSIILVGLLVIGLGYVGVRLLGPVRVSALSPGDCVTSYDVRMAHRVIDGLNRASCDFRHAAEVVAVTRLGPAQVRAFTPSAAAGWCGRAVIEAGTSLNALAAQDLQVRPLLQSRTPEPGDRLVCLARDATGDRLSAPISLG